MFANSTHADYSLSFLFPDEAAVGVPALPASCDEAIPAAISTSVANSFSSSSSSSFYIGAHNYYWIQGDVVHIHLWPQDDHTSIPSLQHPPDWDTASFALVDVVNWERLNMAGRRWYKCYDHLTECWFASWLETSLEDIPQLAEAVKVYRFCKHPMFNVAEAGEMVDRISFYRPLHTLLYMHESARERFPQPYRVMIKHRDGNTLNNYAPDFYDMVLKGEQALSEAFSPAQNVRDPKNPEIFCCEHCNLDLWVIPACSIRQLYGLVTLHFPRVALFKSPKGISAEVFQQNKEYVRRWRFHNYEKDPDSRLGCVLVSYIATLLAPYVSRAYDVDDLSGREGRKQAIAPRVIMRVPSPPRIFTEPITQLGNYPEARLLSRAETDRYMQKLFNAKRNRVRTDVFAMGRGPSVVLRRAAGEKRKNRDYELDSDVEE